MSGKVKMAPMATLSTGTIAKHILVIRDQKVLLDTDLAELYGVPSKILVQAVMRIWIASRMISCFSWMARNGNL